MSQFHNLFRKVVVEKEAPPSRPAEAVLETAEQNYALQNLPIVGMRLEAASRLVFHTDPQSVGAERFRLLRMRLQERSKARTLKKILVTSPLPHDGKSTVALNLACALAEKGRRSVLLVEGDLHHPQILERLGLESTAGLGECLEDNSSAFHSIRRIEPLGCYVLPAGAARANATELLHSSTVHILFQDLTRYFDWIVIDTPPVLPLTDALFLRDLADACLLVVRADSTPRNAVDQAVTLVGKEHILGIVLNGVEGLQRLYSKYGYHRSKP